MRARLTTPRLSSRFSHLKRITRGHNHAPGSLASTAGGSIPIAAGRRCDGRVCELSNNCGNLRFVAGKEILKEHARRGLRKGMGGAYRHITPMSLGGMPACSSWRSSWQTTVASAEFVMLPPGRTHSLHAITLEFRDVVSIQSKFQKDVEAGSTR